MTTATTVPKAAAAAAEATPATKASANPRVKPAPAPTPPTTTTKTASVAHAAVTGLRRTPAPPPPPPPPPTPPPTARTTIMPPLSDKATILLIRRTLCPQDGPVAGAGVGSAAGVTTNTNPGTGDSAASFAAGTTGTTTTTTPIEDLLPPLTSRNDVDLQLYALLAVVVREFVQTWYSKISPDEQFVAEIVQIVAHCTRTLEQRLRKVDLESLLFDELPTLLDNHHTARRAHPWRGRRSRPTPQAANEAAYRQLLVRGVLAVLLPTEDLANDCLTALVGPIFSELLIGNVLARRLAEPWMMWEMVGLLARLVREKLDGDVQKTSSSSSSSRKSKAAQPQIAPPQPQEATQPVPVRVPKASRLASTVAPVFWLVLRVGFALIAALRFLVVIISLLRSPRLRRRNGPPLLDTSSSSNNNNNKDKNVAPSSASVFSTAAAASTAGSPTPDPVPVLAFSLWTTVANIAQLEVRMPWLYGSVCLLQWLALTGPGRIAGLNGPVDRLLSHAIHTYVLDPALLPTLLRALRGAVFPGNKFGTTPPTLVAPANDAELAALKRRTATAVYAVWGGSRLTKQPPPSLSPAPPEAVLREIEGGLLDVLGDAYCNKHLLYGVLEAVLVRLMPELAETGVLELWAERLS
ncbi:Phox-associated domain protein [Niveomyces insectorum RCEF 264]|uniref:Phox-associated domain protein n=1 Tax=Niveomyces insectorum RCEF 264 TaxID=1081102 RepID=A0A167QQG3_9HYPO|nr:Phox-associated domain protein [Niveomyces insectorum RCEF 264]